MASTGIQSYNSYADALARKRRKAIIKGLVISTAVGIALAAIIGYFMFFTPYFQINEFIIKGLKTTDEEKVKPSLDSFMEQRVFHLFRFIKKEQDKNILFFDSESLKNHLLAQFPIIKSVEIKKEYFHKVVLNFSERTPLGAWCFDIVCSYFDEDGMLWGKAIKSSGSLLLTVEDYRKHDQVQTKADPKFLEAIKKIYPALNELGVKIKDIQIPENSIGSFRIYTPDGYYLIFDAESDVKKQVDTLSIFLTNQDKSFKPQYVDLRIVGRVYYK